MSSDSDSEYEDCPATSKKLQRDIVNLLEMEPAAMATGPITTVEGLRKNLTSGLDQKIRKLRSTTKSMDRKQIDDVFRELSADVAGIGTKLSNLYECVMGMLDKMEDYD